MGNSNEIKLPKEKKTKRILSIPSIIILILALFIAVSAFIFSNRAGNLSEEIQETYANKIAESNAENSEAIKVLNQELAQKRQEWVEENAPEIFEKYLPIIEDLEAQLAEAVEGLKDGNEIAKVSEPYKKQIDNYTKAMNSEIDPLFNNEPTGIAKYYQDAELALRNENNTNTKNLSAEMDEKLIYPNHTSDLFTLIALFGLGIVLWILSAYLSKKGFIKGSTKLLNIVPFTVFIIEISVFLIAILALSFGDGIPKEMTGNFDKYIELVRETINL